MKNHSLKPILDATLFDAGIFDLDGVITKTARVHATAWQKLFDNFLQSRATQTGEPFRAFDLIHDYRAYVDGKPRYDGVASFLTSRGIHVPHGEPSDPPGHETICGLGNRKNGMFLEALHAHGVEVFPSTIALINFLKSKGKATAVVTASENCHEILQAAGVPNLFDAHVDGRDAQTFHLHVKPHSDTFVKAAKLLEVQPQRAAVFEDALAGVEAGHAGHFGLVVGIDRANQAEALHAHGGDVVVSDLVELGVRDEESVMWRSTQALPSALQQFKALNAQFHEKQVVVFLDYDGTLTPIVERPELAVLSQDMRDALKLLSRQCPVGIISGRDRKDVTNLVNLDSLIFAGSHGFDIAGPEGWNLHHEVGAQFSSALDQAEADLRIRLQAISGSVIERKKNSIAVHYRLVEQDNVAEIEQTVTQVLSTFPTLRRSEGKKVFEIQPRLDWDKGKALLWLLERLEWKKNNYYPVYIGDDLTDEDAFRVLPNTGVGIVVEEGFRFSSAQYALHNPHEVQQFIMLLCHHLVGTQK
ncbi:MAG: trehalose-phosphatase [Nitrospirae bacterium]|nr:trehalose-phosphatase [Nitrospirota bacterium]MDA1302692.1 trehalose-phosphatase [Nitrospirota bacterium]